MTAFINGSPLNAKEVYEKYISADTIYAPHEGFYANYSNINTEIANRQKLVVEYFELPLLMGNFIEKDLDSQVEKLKQSGTDKIVAELQSQLDKWVNDNK